MSGKKETKSVARRDFFKKVGLGVGAAAVAASSSSAKAATELARGPGQAGYRETDHVKKYYALLRF